MSAPWGTLWRTQSGGLPAPATTELDEWITPLDYSVEHILDTSTPHSTELTGVQMPINPNRLTIGAIDPLVASDDSDAFWYGLTNRKAKRQRCKARRRARKRASDMFDMHGCRLDASQVTDAIERVETALDAWESRMK